MVDECLSCQDLLAEVTRLRAYQECTEARLRQSGWHIIDECYDALPASIPPGTLLARVKALVVERDRLQVWCQTTTIASPLLRCAACQRELTEQTGG